MFKSYSYLIFIFLVSCSSTKEHNDEQDVLSSALKVMEKQRTVNYGPTDLSATEFIDKTEQYGLENISATYMAAVDLNEDNFTDLVLIKEYFSQPEFYIFNPTHKKFEKSPTFFEEVPKASYALFYDFTGDNVLDVVIGVLNQKTEISKRPLRLFKGFFKKRELRFKEEVGAFSLEAHPTATLGVVDFDLDGDLDLFVGNWLEHVQRGTIPSKDFLLENKSGKFSDVSHLLEGEDEFNPDQTMRMNAIPTFSSQVCDMDLNGFPDILAVGTHSYLNKLWLNRYSSKQSARVFRNYGIGSLFAGDPEGNLSSRGGGRTFGVACADYNQDGIMDVFLGELSHNYDSDVVDKSSILTGSSAKFPPTFIRTEYQLDAHDIKWNQADRRGVWLDYDNNGLVDLLVDNSGYPPHTRMLLFKQLPDHSFENKGKEVGIDIVNPLSTISLDINKDGKMDILTAQSELRDARIKRRLYLFENNSKNENRSIRFYLEGKKSNKLGLNATISLKVKGDGKVDKRTQHVNYSYGGLVPQNEVGVHYGIKSGETPLSVEVMWPHAESINLNKLENLKHYDLGSLDFKRTINVTLCESGKFLVGRRKCPRF